MGIIELFKGKKVYLDTNLFIYILEGYSEYNEFFSDFIRGLENHDFVCFTSELTLAELLVPTFKKKKSQLLVKYKEMLNNSDFVTLIPTIQEIYIRSASNRANFGLKLPDAIHVASAQIVGCDLFLTNDQGIKTPKNIKRIILSDLKES
jgi:predicted nucleic acid-binding protein